MKHNKELYQEQKQSHMLANKKYRIHKSDYGKGIIGIDTP